MEFVFQDKFLSKLQSRPHLNNYKLQANVLTKLINFRYFSCTVEAIGEMYHSGRCRANRLYSLQFL